MTTTCNHCHASAEFVDDIVHRRGCKFSDAYKLADVSARLQQLEQEKEDWRRSVGLAEARLVEEHAEANAVIERLMAEKAELSAALAETRDALHQLQEKYDALTRVEPAG